MKFIVSVKPKLTKLTIKKKGIKVKKIFLKISV